jgi:hypothetical protein
MSWKCPKCGELGNSKKRVNCNCNSSPLKINAKPKQHRVRKPQDLGLFCKGCNADIRTNDDKEWHADIHGIYNIVRRAEVIEIPRKDSEEKDTRSSAKKIYDYAITKIGKIVIAENNSDEVYAVINVNTHVETIHLGSKRAKQWLRYSYSKDIASDEIHTDDVYQNALEQIISNAQMSEIHRTKVHTRVAQTDDAIWYDLGNEKWEAIKITKESTSKVALDMESPIFRRPQALSQQVYPVVTNDDDLHSDPLDEICKLLLIKKRDFGLFKVHLIAMLLEKYPIPMIVFDGTAGTGKSTLSASIKRIIDPSGRAIEDNVIAMAEKNEELVIQLYHRYLTAFDNVGNFKESRSDILCRAITGGSNPKRKLYTNDDEVMMSFMRKIVLNGVIPSLDYTDLQSRILNYGREEMTGENRKSERQYWKEFDELLPKVLGRIFIVLCKAMRSFDKISPTIKPNTRLADFEIWGEVISQVLGNKKGEFGEMLLNKISEGQNSITDNYPIVSCITILMNNHRILEDTAQNMFSRLCEIAEENKIDTRNKFNKFPTNSSRLVKDLIVVDSLLKTNEIHTSLSHYNKRDGKYPRNASIIKFEKNEEVQGDLDKFSI